MIGKGSKYKLYDKIRSIAIEKKYHLDFINGMEDHIHCLLSLSTVQNVSTIAKDLKGGSSNWVNENNLGDGMFNWQDGYSAFSVSPGNVIKVRNYIRNQEKHHLGMSYSDELEKLKKMSNLVK